MWCKLVGNNAPLFHFQLMIGRISTIVGSLHSWLSSNQEIVTVKTKTCGGEFTVLPQSFIKKGAV